MAVLHAVADGHYRLEGEVELDALKALLRHRVEPKDRMVEMDFSTLENASSAVVVLMVHWSRLARQQGAEVRYSNVPQQLMALIRLYDLPPVFGL